MPTTITVLVVVAVLAAVLVLLFLARLRAIGARVGSFQCTLRTGARWVPGIASYTHDALVWYDVVSLSRRPRCRWIREDLVIVERIVRTDPASGEVVQAQCCHGAETFSITATRAAFEGLVSWLEAAPPGRRSSEVI